jgi:hypothetical protein
MRRIYDEIRKIWTTANPEEIIRQSWLRKMVHELHYPKELLIVEKEIGQLPHLSTVSLPQRRIDILCYIKREDHLFPLLLLECKDEPLSSEALTQVLGYNHFIEAPFVGILNLQQIHLKGNDEEFNHLPSYNELSAWIQ